MAFTCIDYTVEFEHALRSRTFDDWCLAQGVSFCCTLHSDGGKEYMSLMFHQDDLSVGFIDLYAHSLNPKFVFSKSVLTFVEQNYSTLDKMFQLQRNLKTCGMDYEPLCICIGSQREIDTSLTKHETKLMAHKEALIKLYLSTNYECGASYASAKAFAPFFFQGTKPGKAYFKSNEIGEESLYLETIDRFGTFTKHKYSANDVVDLIHNKRFLTHDVRYAHSMSDTVLTSVREVFQLELLGKSVGPVEIMDTLDTNIFEHRP